ncbi:F-box protein CPR1-like [Silene latifolia]|uniref:F-box protein CPR1-like n=1 Tax=Silene latifolia TaxID=37657 RepID=UPI003D783F15
MGGKSLVRCRCVCKTFNTEISTPYFIRLNLQYTAAYNGNRLLILPVEKRGQSAVLGFNLDDRLSHESPLLVTPYLVYIFGSCNGLLLCYRACSHLLSLHNPINGNIKYIDIDKIDNSFFSSLGFRFDETHNDYKMVAIWENYDFSQDQQPERTVKVYSVMEDTWRITEYNYKIRVKDILDGCCSGVLIGNSLLHWMFWCPLSNRRHRIGCFDICSETWISDVVLPDYYYNSTECWIYLLEIGELDGRLCCSLENKIESCFDVWVMEEYGVKDSWTMLLSIPVIDDSLLGGIVAVARVGCEVLVKHRDGCELWWYNIREKTMADSAFTSRPHVTPLV